MRTPEQKAAAKYAMAVTLGIPRRMAEEAKATKRRMAAKYWCAEADKRLAEALVILPAGDGRNSWIM